MPTPRERYIDALEEITRRYENLDDATIRRLIALLQNVRKEMALVLADNPTDFERFRLSSLKASVDDIITVFQSGLTTDLNAGLVGAGQIGLSAVVEPLDAIGLNVSSFNVLSPRQRLDHSYTRDMAPISP